MASKAEQANVHFKEALDLEKKNKDPIAAYSRGIALDPAEWALQNRGWAYFKKGDFAKAVEDWNRVGDDYAKPRGRAKLKVGDYDGAIKDLLMALKRNDAPDIRGYLAEAYTAKGDTKRAAQYGGAKAAPAPAKFVPPKRKKGESYDDFVERALTAAAFAPATRKAIEALRRPAVFVTAEKAPPKGVGASRLGGTPDLPKGAAWPRNRGKPMSFVAQFRLDAIAKIAKTPLPKKGLLAFFVAEDEDDYLEKGAVLCVPADELENVAAPADFERMADGDTTKKPYKPRAVAFTTGRKLPPVSNPAMKSVRWGAGERDRYEALMEEAIEFDRHQLLGYRDRAYDAEQKATTALLFQCFSEKDMTWGDEDHLYFYVADQALAAGDFKKAFTYSGE